MTVDRVTEEIAHFVGMFLQADQSDLRDPDYDAFNFQALQQPLAPLSDDAADHRYIYGPEGYDPNVGEARNDAAPIWPGLSKGGLAFSLASGPGRLTPQGTAGSETTSAALPGPLPRIEMPPVADGIAPPASFAFSLQFNGLTDRDVLSVDPEAATAWFSAQGALLIELVHAAALRTPVDLGATFVPTYPGFAELETLALEAAAYASGHIAASDTAAPDGIDAPTARFFATGADARGAFVDGRQAEGSGFDALPAWRDNLPELPELTPLGGLTAASFRIGDGAVSGITGGNLALNQATLVHQRIDAPVILVGGSVLAWDYISQVNILQDDGGDGALGPAATNHVQNAAYLTEGTASATGMALPLSVVTGQTPDLVVMTTIEGDLVNYSWTAQWNAADDTDILSLSGGRSWVVTGQNQLINVEQLVTFGQAFDLIIVGGDMVTVSAVSQTNILMDVDETPTTRPSDPPTEAEPDGAPSSQTPLPEPSGKGDPGVGQTAAPAASAIPQSPQAEAASPAPSAGSSPGDGQGPHSAPQPEPSAGHTATADADPAPQEATDANVAARAIPDPGPGGTETVTATVTPGRASPGEEVKITGATEDDETAQAVPAAGNAPTPTEEQRETAEAARPVATGEPVEQTAASPAPGAAQEASETVAPGTHDNVLINTASIAHTSIDTVSGLADNLREMVEGLDPDAPDLTDLISSPVFAGLDTMSVLYVTGDLTNVHAVEQTNLVSDGDKLIGAGAGDAIAGANALVNSAVLSDAGLNSTVMAAGEIYTDAFLHQAELVSTADDAVPDFGGSPAPLASEAVAFLADAMQAGHAAFERSGAHHDGVAGTNIGDAGPPADIMQSFLA